MNSLLENQVALVTGASGGLGAGICEQLANAGARVIVHGFRQPERAQAVVHRIQANGADAEAVSGDISSDEGCRELMDAANVFWGPPDVLVNNAGIQPAADINDIGRADLTAMFEANVLGPFRLMQLFVACLPSSKSVASIINIASIEADRPALHHSHYAASKAALIKATEAAAAAWGSRGVRVNAVSPGLIHRDGIEDDWPSGVQRWLTSAPLARLGTPADIGQAVAFLASSQAAWITGHNLVVDGGVSVQPGW